MLLRRMLWPALALLLDFPCVSVPHIGTFLMPCAEGCGFAASLVKSPGERAAQAVATGSSGMRRPPLHRQGVPTSGL